MKFLMSSITRFTNRAHFFLQLLHLWGPLLDYVFMKHNATFVDGPGK
jgi:hypothetical protein